MTALIFYWSLIVITFLLCLAFVLAATIALLYIWWCDFWKQKGKEDANKHSKDNDR